MIHAIGRFALWVVGALAIVMLTSSIASASDFGQIVDYAIFLMAKMAGGALLLAIATEAILARLYHRKISWLLVAFIAVVWFIVIFGLFQWWRESQARQHYPPRPPALQKSIEQKSKQADAPPPTVFKTTNGFSHTS